jgi:hypothetical protein
MVEVLFSKVFINFVWEVSKGTANKRNFNFYAFFKMQG